MSTGSLPSKRMRRAPHLRRIRTGTLGLYYMQKQDNGDVFKFDGSASLSLFDLYSNFTFLLNDPVSGDAIQQHDSRLQEGANAYYFRPHKVLVGHLRHRQPCQS